MFCASTLQGFGFSGSGLAAAPIIATASLSTPCDTGRILGTFGASEYSNRVFLFLAGGTLYLTNFGGKLAAIDLKTQKPAWVFETDGAKQNAASMTNADGSIKFETKTDPFCGHERILEHNRRRLPLAPGGSSADYKGYWIRVGVWLLL